jgi:hypothetical protein
MTFKGYRGVMLCKFRVVALVYQVITGITSSLLAMRDVQLRVRGAVAFSELQCVTSPGRPIAYCSPTNLLSST